MIKTLEKRLISSLPLFPPCGRADRVAVRQASQPEAFLPRSYAECKGDGVIAILRRMEGEESSS